MSTRKSPLVADGLLAAVVLVCILPWAISAASKLIFRMQGFIWFGQRSFGDELSPQESLLAGLVVALTFTVPLVWRRANTGAAFVAMSPGLVFLLLTRGLPVQGWGASNTLTAAWLPLVVMVYSVARYISRPKPWLVASLTGCGLLGLAASLSTLGTFFDPLGLSTARLLVVMASGFAEAVVAAVAVILAWRAGRWAAQHPVQLPELTGLDGLSKLRIIWRDRPELRDIAVPAVLFVPTWFWLNTALLGNLTYYTPASSQLTDSAGLLVAIGFTGPLVWRRTRTDIACVALIPALVVQLISSEMLLGYGLLPIGDLAVPIMVYSAARYSKYATAWLIAGLGAAGAAGLRWAGRYYWGDNWVLGNFGALQGAALSVLTVTLLCAVVVAVSWSLGRVARYRRQSADLAVGRALAVESEQEQIRRLAAEQERSRIAREMHDIVAHSLSVIVVQADGAGYTLDQPVDSDRKLVVAASALEVIGTTARTALTETRRLVGVLRAGDNETEFAPMVTLAAIPILLDRTRAAGLPIEACIEGDPQEHAPLGAGAEAAAYRIVQEALTNVMKHAGPGAFATVGIEHTAQGLTVMVRDDGHGPQPGDGQGNGLIGMRERVAAFGGTLVAQPRQPKGFEVIATLPAPALAGRLD